MNADAFLWGESVFNRLGRFDGLGEEMRAIVLDSLRDYPLTQIEAAVAATARQLMKIATGEGVSNQIWHTYGIIHRYTPAVVPSMQAARQQHGEIAFEAINDVHAPVALIAAALLPVLIVAGVKWWDRPDLSLLAATVAVALIVNAVVCGALSNPHDRYGARLIWLAPLTLMLAPISVFAATVEMEGLAAAPTSAI